VLVKFNAFSDISDFSNCCCINRQAEIDALKVDIFRCRELLESAAAARDDLTKICNDRIRYGIIDAKFLKVFIIVEEIGVII
jgi:hypothetical protein